MEMTLKMKPLIRIIFLIALISLQGTLNYAQEGNLSVGSYAIVNTIRNDTLNVRENAGINHRILERLPNGARVLVVDSPVSADGYLWWKVETSSGTVGWAVEGADGLQTLLPVVTRAEQSDAVILEHSIIYIDAQRQYRQYPPADAPQLTSHSPSSRQQVVLSPEGGYFAYVSVNMNTGSESLIIQDLHRDRETSVQHFAGCTYDWHPDDSRYIVYTCREPSSGRRNEVWLLDVSTGIVDLLFKTDEGLNLSPDWFSWSPDRRFIATLVSPSGDGGFLSASGSVVIGAVKGETILEISDSMFARSPWAPNQRSTLVFPYDNRLIISNPDGSDQRDIYTSNMQFVSYVAWSTDGNHMALTENSYNGQNQLESSRIAVLDSNGQNPRYFAASRVGFQSTSLTWSPDSRFIAFMETNYDGWSNWGNHVATLKVIDLERDTVNDLLLTFRVVAIHGWSPDNRYLLVSDEEGTLWIVSVDDRVVTAIGEGCCAQWLDESEAAPNVTPIPDDAYLAPITVPNVLTVEILHTRIAADGSGLEVDFEVGNPLNSLYLPFLFELEGSIESPKLLEDKDYVWSTLGLIPPKGIFSLPTILAVEPRRISYRVKFTSTKQSLRITSNPFSIGPLLFNTTETLVSELLPFQRVNKNRLAQAMVSSGWPLLTTTLSNLDCIQRGPQTIGDGSNCLLTLVELLGNDSTFRDAFRDFLVDVLNELSPRTFGREGVDSVLDGINLVNRIAPYVDLGVSGLLYAYSGQVVNFYEIRPVTVADHVPWPPTLNSPLGVVSGEEISLNWNGLPDVTSYHLQVAANPDFITPILDIPTVLETTFLPQVEFEPGVNYFWRVRAQYGDLDARSAWSTGAFTRQLE